MVSCRETIFQETDGDRGSVEVYSSLTGCLLTVLLLFFALCFYLH